MSSLMNPSDKLALAIPLQYVSMEFVRRNPGFSFDDTNDGTFIWSFVTRASIFLTPQQFDFWFAVAKKVKNTKK